MNELTTDAQRLEQALERLFIKNPEFQELEGSFDEFCPFEALGMINQEIRHSHFLSYITDPHRPHGFRTECLRALLHSATAHGNGLSGALTPLQVHLLSFEGANVRREWRNIDFLIEFRDERLVVAVELKINAGESRDQLARYRETVLGEWPAADGWKHAFLYLTKRGDSPSSAYGTGWTALPLAAFARELQDVAAGDVGNREARELLQSYLNMLRRRHLQNTRLEQLARRLWAEHREALSYLMEQQPDISGSLFGELRTRLDAIATAVSAKTGLTLVADESNSSYLRLAVEDWDALPGLKSAQGWTKTNRLILIEIVRSALIVKLELGPGDPAVRQHIWDGLGRAGALKTPRMKLTRGWKLLTSQSLRPGDDEQEVTADSAQELIVAWLAEVLPAFHRTLSPPPTS